MTLWYEWLGPVMFLGCILFLASGYPVSFSLAGVAIFFGLIGIGIGAFEPRFIQALPERFYGTMSNYTLLAIPYFVFLGAMLEKSGLAEDLLETMGLLFGGLRGGIAIAVIVVGTMLAATTGVVAATVVAMGLISLPIMLRYGYQKEFATGVICAAGTLGQIIPPSVVLVVLGDQLGVSVGALYIAAIIPGLMISGSFLVYTLIRAYLQPQIAPAIPAAERAAAAQGLWLRVLKVMIPPLVLILIVLGSIFFGIATPTESGVVGAVGATVLALLNRKLSWKALYQVSDATTRNAAMVIFILFGSTAFALIFRGLGGDTFMFDTLKNLPGGQIGFLIISILVVFVLGFFIDFFEICFIIVPLFAPVAKALGIDMLWFGILLGCNLQTSFLTPPFGFALFYLRGVAPQGVTSRHIYRGVPQFIALQVLVVIMVIVYPNLSSWLPEQMANAPR